MDLSESLPADPEPPQRGRPRNAGPAVMHSTTHSLAGARLSVWIRPQAESGVRTPLDLDRLGALAQAAADHLAAQTGATGELRVRIVGDDEMTRLHAEHLDDPTTTDVLTFDLRDDPEADPPLPLDTDIIVCVDEARRVAGRLGRAIEEELLLYIIHGALHCLGESDTDEASARRMASRQDDTLCALGLAPAGADKPPILDAGCDAGCDAKGTL